MLVMTTIFTSVMEKLPLTSYPKMIDFWLIFCQLVPFAEVIRQKIKTISYKVVLLTAMEFLRFRDMNGVEFPLDSFEKTSTGSGSGKWLNRLKVVGEYMYTEFNAHYISFSEKKVLPFAVLLVGMLYTAIAARFYFE